MSNYNVKDVPQGYFFSQNAYLDDGFILLSPEMPFSQDLAKILNEWKFSQLISNGEPLDYYSGKPFDKKTQGFVQNDIEKIHKAEEFIQSLENFTAELYTRVSTRYAISYETIAERIKELCAALRDNKKYILQVSSSKRGIDESEETFHAVHSVKSAIVAIVMGIYLKLPTHKLIELGTAAIVHEIGMIKLPSSLYKKKDSLSPEEFSQLKHHTTLGFEILRSNNFPLAVSTTALEHHERENGMGYPRKLNASYISYYSKIIAVACSYAAITVNRPHQDARVGYEGITDLMRNEGKQYDDSVVRALVFSLSIYPIGQYVELSSGKKGQVVDINPADPRYPVVQLLGELNPDGKNKLIVTSHDGIFVARPLELEDVDVTIAK